MIEENREIEISNRPVNEEEAKHCSAEIKNCLEALRKGGVILIPTDTIWGLSCDASDPAAVKRIFDIKRRADSKSMLVLVGSEAMLDRTVADIPEVAWELVEVADKSLTIIYDKPRGVASELLAEDGSLGIRMTRDYFSSRLCERFRKPIVSTSANISGSPSPKRFSEISQEILDAVDYIADWRRSDNRPASPSGIIKLSNSGEVKIIR